MPVEAHERSEQPERLEQAARRAPLGRPRAARSIACAVPLAAPVPLTFDADDVVGSQGEATLGAIVLVGAVGELDGLGLLTLLAGEED